MGRVTPYSYILLWKDSGIFLDMGFDMEFVVSTIDSAIRKLLIQ